MFRSPYPCDVCDAPGAPWPKGLCASCYRAVRPYTSVTASDLADLGAVDEFEQRAGKKRHAWS